MHKEEWVIITLVLWEENVKFIKENSLERCEPPNERYKTVSFEGHQCRNSTLSAMMRRQFSSWLQKSTTQRLEYSVSPSQKRIKPFLQVLIIIAVVSATLCSWTRTFSEICSVSIIPLPRFLEQSAGLLVRVMQQG